MIPRRYYTNRPYKNNWVRPLHYARQIFFVGMHKLFCQQCRALQGKIEWNTVYWENHPNVTYPLLLLVIIGRLISSSDLSSATGLTNSLEMNWRDILNHHASLRKPHISEGRRGKQLSILGEASRFTINKWIKDLKMTISSEWSQQT